MTYSFQKRKELNDVFINRYPDLPVEYRRDGVPFVHLEQLPVCAERVGSIYQLKSLIPDTPYPWREVLPVAYRIKRMNESGVFEDLYEISYVNCTAKSLDMAEKKIDKGNLWMFPEVINLNK